MLEFLKPIQDKRKYYLDNPELVDQILIEGTNKAKKKAQEVIKRVKNNMKINYFD